jgi:hypothetical protein
MSSFVMLFTSQKKSARGHDIAKLQHTVASPKIRAPQDLSTHAKESISSLESLQKASEWAQSHVNVSCGKFGGLGNVSAIVKQTFRDYVAMFLCSSCVGFEAKTSAHPSEGITRGNDDF